MNFPVRIIHPDHGAMLVYNAQELELHKERGWEVEVEEVKPKKPGPKPK